MDWEKFNQKKIQELPIFQIKKYIKYLQETLAPEVLPSIKEARELLGPDWWIEAHFHWGMHMRNHLRKGGFLDENLPSKNWDDYYVPIFEIAAGTRALTGKNIVEDDKKQITLPPPKKMDMIYVTKDDVIKQGKS